MGWLCSMLAWNMVRDSMHGTMRQTSHLTTRVTGRECYCSPYLSALTEKLSDSRCIYSCVGNASEVCGGQLALTLYNLTAADSKTGIAWSQFSGAAGYGTLAVITLIIAAVL